jgi:hypothetical protein
MLIQLLLIVLISAQTNKQVEYLSLFGRPFGYKDPLWITCTNEDRDCNREDRLNSTDAHCMSRVLYDVKDMNDQDYKDELEIDDKLDPSYYGKIIARCVVQDDFDTFLPLNLVRDMASGILASYEYLPTLTAQEAADKEYREQMYILESETPQFYSRFLAMGFKEKFADILAVRPEWRVKVWFENFSFTPKIEGVVSRRYLLHYYIACMVCFILSYLVEYMN